MINRLPGSLLRRHVGNLSLNHAELSDGALTGSLCNAEIDDLYVSFVCDEDVLRANVSMDDVERLSLIIFQVVSIVKTRTDSRNDIEGKFVTEWHPFFLRLTEDVTEVFSEEILHSNKIGVLHGSEVVDLNDVLVVEQGCKLGLVNERSDELFLACQMRKDGLDGDELFKALNARDLCFVELAIPPTASFSKRRYFPKRVVPKSAITSFP